MHLVLGSLNVVKLMESERIERKESFKSMIERQTKLDTLRVRDKNFLEIK